tara:strand:+ start:342 stop:494 length:153 start_codon:yes stop_codon:yes gene_type:complete
MGRPGRKKLTEDEIHRAEILVTYSKMLKENKIRIGGAAHKRLKELYKRWR